MDMQGSVTLADRVHEIEGIGWNEHIHCPLADFAGPLVYDGYLDSFRLADLFSSRRSLAASRVPASGVLESLPARAARLRETPVQSQRDACTLLCEVDAVGLLTAGYRVEAA